MICVKIKRTFLSLRPRGPKDTARNNMQGALTVYSPPPPSSLSPPIISQLVLCLCLCVGSVYRVLKQPTADSLAFLYITHYFFFSLSLLCFLFHMLISSSSMRVRGREVEITKTITGYRHKQGCSPRAGQGSAGQGRHRDGHLRWFLFRSNKFLCGNHFIIRLSVRNEPTTDWAQDWATVPLSRYSVPCALLPYFPPPHSHSLLTVIDMNRSSYLKCRLQAMEWEQNWATGMGMGIGKSELRLGTVKVLKLNENICSFVSLVL